MGSLEQVNLLKKKKVVPGSYTLELVALEVTIAYIEYSEETGQGLLHST